MNLIEMKVWKGLQMILIKTDDFNRELFHGEIIKSSMLMRNCG